MSEIKFISDGNAGVPVRGSTHAAGWDLAAAEDTLLEPYKATKISTGLRCEIPKGHTLLIFPRSGLSLKHQIMAPNAVGVIDEDFRGAIHITMIWMPDPTNLLRIDRETVMTPQGSSFKISKGDRIGQAVLVKYEEQDWRIVNALSETARGDGGFGSTGV